MADLVTAGAVYIYDTSEPVQATAGEAIGVFDAVYQDGAVMRKLSASIPLASNAVFGLALTAASSGCSFQYVTRFCIDFYDRNPPGVVWVASRNAGRLAPQTDLIAKDYVHLLGTSVRIGMGPFNNAFMHRGRMATGVRLASTAASGDVSVSASEVLPGKDADVAEYGAMETVAPGDVHGLVNRCRCGTTAYDSCTIGLATSDATAGQSFMYCFTGVVRLSESDVLTKGELYVASANAGKLKPYRDLATDEYLTVVGWAKDGRHLYVNSVHTQLQKA